MRLNTHTVWWHLQEPTLHTRRNCNGLRDLRGGWCCQGRSPTPLGTTPLRDLLHLSGISANLLCVHSYNKYVWHIECFTANMLFIFSSMPSALLETRSISWCTIALLCYIMAMQKASSICISWSTHISYTKRHLKKRERSDNDCTLKTIRSLLWFYWD